MKILKQIIYGVLILLPVALIQVAIIIITQIRFDMKTTPLFHISNEAIYSQIVIVVLSYLIFLIIYNISYWLPNVVKLDKIQIILFLSQVSFEIIIIATDWFQIYYPLRDNSILNSVYLSIVIPIILYLLLLVSNRFLFKLSLGRYLVIIICLNFFSWLLWGLNSTSDKIVNKFSEIKIDYSFYYRLNVSKDTYESNKWYIESLSDLPPSEFNILKKQLIDNYNERDFFYKDTLYCEAEYYYELVRVIPMYFFVSQGLVYCQDSYSISQNDYLWFFGWKEIYQYIDQL